MKQPLAIAALSLAAAATPFLAVRDNHARARIARQQQQINRLNYLASRLQLEIENVADCTNSVYPITFKPDGTIALSFTPATDKAFMPIGRDGGCLAATPQP